MLDMNLFNILMHFSFTDESSTRCFKTISMSYCSKLNFHELSQFGSVGHAASKQCGFEKKTATGMKHKRPLNFFVI